MSLVLEDRLKTQMVIPVSKGTYFNTNWTPTEAPLCPYDMLYHPPDYNPKSARSDRQEPKIIKRNIWNQELHKGIPSTTHFQLGRPKWKPFDLPTKQFVRAQGFLTDLQSVGNAANIAAKGQLMWNGLYFRLSDCLCVKNENPHMRIEKVLEWAVLLNEGKPMCD